MENHKRIQQLIDSAGSTYISVNFTKKDGSARQLTFNAKDLNDIKGTGNPTSDPNIFRIRDIKLGAWRSFDARRVLSISAQGEQTIFAWSKEA